MSRQVNEIVGTTPENEFDKFKNHRGVTSYHPKMMLKIILYTYTQSVFWWKNIKSYLMIALE